MVTDMKQLVRYLTLLLEANIPYQFVPLTGFPLIQRFCQELKLPKPKLLAGNIIIGNLDSCDFLLTAHLDEVSFGFKNLENKGSWLTPYHDYLPSKKTNKLTILGVRNNKIENVGKGNLVIRKGRPFCMTNAPLMIGDRAVYFYLTRQSKNTILGKAIDDRVGVLIALLAVKNALENGFSVAVVLSDGEEGVPGGYFSKNFAHILPKLKNDCWICFIDGIFQKGLKPAGYSSLPKNALITSHSSDGRGYIVPPKMFAWLRDEMIPKAQKRGIGVELCTAYRSRGDEWGMITNPVIGKVFRSFFVDFGTWGGFKHHVPLTVNLDSIKNCVSFILLVVEDRFKQDK